MVTVKKNVMAAIFIASAININACDEPKGSIDFNIERLTDIVRDQRGLMPTDRQTAQRIIAVYDR